MVNEQRYWELRQKVLFKEPTEERMLLLDVMEHLNYTINRINEYNRLPWWKKLFMDI